MPSISLPIVNEISGDVMSGKVLVVDDDQHQANDVADFVASTGQLVPVVVTNFRDIESLHSHIDASLVGVVCDHKLSYSQNAPFFGAEFVAALYGKTPAVLLTAYLNAEEQALTIRAHRRRMPVVLERSNLEEPDEIRFALEKCRAEFAGLIADDRAPTRSLIRIDSHDKRIATIFIANWRQEAFEIPLSLIPERDLATVLTDGAFLASVNTGTELLRDIFVEYIGLAPKAAEL